MITRDIECIIVCIVGVAAFSWFVFMIIEMHLESEGYFNGNDRFCKV